MRSEDTPGFLRPLGRLTLSVFLLSMAGCATFDFRPIDATTSAESWNRRALGDEGLHTFLAQASPRPPVTWPQLDWNLDQLTLAALYFQPSLDVARAQLEVARSAAITAGQRPNPTLNASATYDTTTRPPWIPAISFDLPVETAGKRGHRSEAAERNAEAARWGWVDQIWQVRAGVRSNLLAVYRARRSAALLERQVSARAEVVRLLEGQLQAGAIAPTDVSLARIALRTDQLGWQQAQQAEGEALAGLAEAIGLPDSSLADVKLSFAGLEQLPPAVPARDTQLEAVLHRADVRGGLATYAASQADLQLEIANQYPDIHLGPGYEFDQTDNKWTLGLTLPLPLLNRNEGPIAEARARRRLAAAQFVAIQAKALNEVALAILACRSTREQWQTATVLLEDQRQRRESVRAQQRAGDADPLATATADVEYDTEAAIELATFVKAQESLGRLEAVTQSSSTIPPQELRATEDKMPVNEGDSHER
ncbi:MAG TPA: TolC family protein [Candidatus Didemnitutus sp.]|jgi:outer membrane protein TolC